MPLVKRIYHTNFKLMLLIFVAAGLGMCKNELPTPGENDPVFYVNALVNETAIQVQAGNNAVLMRPFYAVDSLNIVTYGGFIGKLNCAAGDACPESFELHIRQLETEMPGNNDVSKDLVVGSYGVRGPATQVFQTYKATFTSQALPLGVQHNWYFGDGSQSTNVNPVHYYTNQKDSLVEPLLVVSNSSNGCTSTIQYPVNFKMPCITDVHYFVNGPLVGIEALPNGNTDLWDFGLGFMPLGAGNPIPMDSLFLVCLESTANSGCLAQKCENIVQDSSVVACVANFDVKKETLTIDDERNFGEITLFHTLPNGQRFSSKSATQPGDSYFEILAVSDYQSDAQGNPTKKLTVRFKLRLVGEDPSSTITIQSEESSFCVSYP